MGFYTVITLFWEIIPIFPYFPIINNKRNNSRNPLLLGLSTLVWKRNGNIRINVSLYNKREYGNIVNIHGILELTVCLLG